MEIKTHKRHLIGHEAATGRRVYSTVRVRWGQISQEGPTAVTFTQSTQLDFTEINSGCRGGETDVTASVRLPSFRGNAQTSTFQVNAPLTCIIWRSRVPGFWTVCRRVLLWWWPAETLAGLRGDCRPCRTLWCPCRTYSGDGRQINPGWGRPLERLRAL